MVTHESLLKIAQKLKTRAFFGKKLYAKEQWTMAALSLNSMGKTLDGQTY